MPRTSERTPLLWELDHSYSDEGPARAIRTRHDFGDDVHTQFCALTGCPPSNAPAGYKHQSNSKLLYGRTTSLLRSQNRSYIFSAALSNTLLLTQVILGAALTGLGASGAPSWVVTVFGATNTIIAGVVAYLKSRGQPMRSRMYRDDLERVVDEIENSEVMWLGISQGVHGYEEIDTDGEVTVRSEVARLTRLYDRAVRNNAMNNPEMYMAGSGDSNHRAGLRSREAMAMQAGGGANIALPAVMPAGEVDAAPAAPGPAPIAPAPVAADPDESPASAPPKKVKEDAQKDEGQKKDAGSTAQVDGTSDAKSDASPSSSNDDKGKSTEQQQAPSSSSAQSSSTPSATEPKPAGVVATAPPQDPDSSPATRTKFTRKESSKSATNTAGKKVEGDTE